MGLRRNCWLPTRMMCATGSQVKFIAPEVDSACEVANGEVIVAVVACAGWGAMCAYDRACCMASADSCASCC